MIFRFAPLVIALTAAAGPAQAGLCDAVETKTLLFWSDCEQTHAAAILLLPEDSGLTPDRALDVTGAYTATDKRTGGRPKPVGLFVRRGEVISREYVRFDGVLIVDRAGDLRIGYRRRLDVDGERFDLERTQDRRAVLASMAASGGSLFQSHLLIIDGVVDAAPIDGAPRFRRRILMQDDTGAVGLFDSSPRALTLNEAAEEVARDFAPTMALNLDMGSYDFCRRGGELCGALRYSQTGELSDVLRVKPK